MILMNIIIISTTTIIITTIIMATILTDNVEGVGVPRGGGEISLGLVSHLNILITQTLLDHHHHHLTQTLVIIMIMVM